MNKKVYLIASALLCSVAAYSQVGINTTKPKAIMDVNVKRTNDDGTGTIDNTQTVGLLAPRLTRAELTANTAAYTVDQSGALIYITDISGGDIIGNRINIKAAGYYYFDGTVWKAVGSGNALAGDNITTMINNNIIKGKFFYMPSIVIDVSSLSTGQFVNLYAKYKEQFQLADATTSTSSTGVGFPTASLVASENDLDYYITYYDKTVFANVKVSVNGILTYDVVGTATDKTYMNIVFALKP